MSLCGHLCSDPVGHHGGSDEGGGASEEFLHAVHSGMESIGALLFSALLLAEGKKAGSPTGASQGQSRTHEQGNMMK